VSQVVQQPQPETPETVDKSGTLRGSRVAEQYRGLRAVIESAGPIRSDATSRSLAVMVVGVEFGTADIGIRLAAAFADGGNETLLLDADLSSPACHSLLQTAGPPPAGLIEWLREDDERPLPTYSSNLTGLSVLPAGRTGGGRDPLRSARVEALFAAARSTYGRIVVVAPPISSSADALFLAPSVDGVVLAVVPGKTGGPAAQRARDNLLATGARIYGAIFADAEGR
jgi:succinoglycan biosynthesis transport protein ExoP